MPKGKPNSYAGGGFIKSMREKHEPHMKLAGRVEGLEKNIPIALTELHKTLSKSFGIQRKTLMRVIALEKKVDSIPRGVTTIKGQKGDTGKAGKSGDGGRRRRRWGGKPKVTTGAGADGADGASGSSGIDGTSGSSGIDGTSGSSGIDGAGSDGIDGTSGSSGIDGAGSDGMGGAFGSDGMIGASGSDGVDIDKALSGIDGASGSSGSGGADGAGGAGGADGLGGAGGADGSDGEKRIHKTISKLTSHTISILKRINALRKEVRNNSKKITLLKNIIKTQKSDLGENLKSLDPVSSPLNQSIQTITDSITSIHQTLLEQQDLDKEKSADAGQDDEQDSRDSKEKGRETEKEGGALQKTGQKMLKPVQGAFDKIKEWLIKLFAAKAIMMFMDWFSDPANAKKVSSIFRFIKDWWPAIVTGLLLFAGSMLGPAGIVIGITALVIGFVPKIINAIKSVFGLGKDVDKEAQKGEKDASKAEALADKHDKGTAGDDLKPEDDPANAPEPGTQETPGEKAPLKMNKGGEVPGSGDKDTVPAMLTPGEFVMSKGAVEEYGTNTLEGMNAAAGGTNIPTLQRGESGGGGTSGTGLLPRYAGGGSASGPDKSHLGQEGYRMGQVRPEMMVYSNEKFESTYKTKGGEVIEDKEDYKEISGSIAVEDLMANQKQLMGQINKVEGFENASIIDVIERVNDRGRLVGMPDEQLYPILNASDAWKATDAKRDEGIRMDQEAGTQFLNPIETAKAVGLNGGGLVPGYAGGGLINPQVSAAKWLGGKAKGAFNAIKNRISSNQAGKAIPGTPVKPTTVIAYAKEAAAKAGGVTSSGSGGPKIPSFSASAKIDNRKVKVLGISR